MSKSSVAVFRPDDDRIRVATQYLQSLGVSPIADSMLLFALRANPRNTQIQVSLRAKLVPSWLPIKDGLQKGQSLCGRPTDRVSITE